MTIFQLECFCALADSLNFTQTANAMFITQPALSRAISSLEQELQLTLLQRTTHSVTLTPAGKIFSSECHKMLKEIQRGSFDFAAHFPNSPRAELFASGRLREFSEWEVGAETRRHGRIAEALGIRGCGHRQTFEGHRIALRQRPVAQGRRLRLRQRLQGHPRGVRAISAAIRERDGTRRLPAFDDHAERRTLRDRTARGMQSGVHLLAEGRALGLLGHGDIHRDPARHAAIDAVDATGLGAAECK